MPDETFDVVAVAPHPDDLEITCGGTLATLVDQGYRVAILDLTTGEPTPRGDLATRAREAEAARQVLGVQHRETLTLTNRELMDGPAARYVLATRLRALRPKIVIGLHGRTPAASPDHYQGQLIIEAARFYSQLTKWDDRFGGTAPYRVPHLVYAPLPFDAEVRHWQGSFLVDITAAMERKLAAIACYASQFDVARLDRVRHWIGSWNGFKGAAAGYQYAEEFALPRPVAGTDLVKLVAGEPAAAAPAAPITAPVLPMG